MPNPEKRSRKFLGIRVPSSLRRQSSPQARADLSSSQTSDPRLDQSPPPKKSKEPTSKLLESVQNADSSAELSNENPLQTAEPVLKATSSIRNTQFAPAPSSGLQSTDLQKTKTRYEEAYNALQKAITKDNYLSDVFDELSADPEGVDDLMFINKLQKALESQNSKVKDRSAWGTCKSTVKYLVHAFKPFAKNFLAIAKEGSAVLRSFSFLYLIFVDSNLEPVWISM
jgi:hypothetical protein